ncbi:hypothetical protein LP415_11155 [Polaromonas sp. P1(28)-8]|nr:hypothetical protein LP415_11155 [Polaromonas sp. P1(28)-8]
MLQMIPKWRAFIDHWLQKQAQVCVTQPLSKTVSANDKAYFAHIGVRKLAWRQLRHALYFKLSGHGKDVSARFQLIGSVACGCTKEFRKSVTH